MIAKIEENMKAKKMQKRFMYLKKLHYNSSYFCGKMFAK